MATQNDAPGSSNNFPVLPPPPDSSQPQPSLAQKRLQQTQAKVDEVVGIMKVNVEKVLERDSKLSELDERADALQHGASQFEQQAGKLKRKHWWANIKMMIIMGVIGVVLLIIIIDFIDYHNVWPSHERQKFIEDMRILPDFLGAEEENQLLEEIEPYLKRMRYEFDHWDDAIHGYRETERRHWYPQNKTVIQRVSDVAFNGQIMPFIHVLDLTEGGVIKPHVDSTRYCGCTIAGLSLLSDSVMRLRRVDETKYVQGSDSDYRSQPLPTSGNTSEHNFYADILLKRRSLYIMSHSARYNFTHEILGNDESQFRNEQVHKSRRISIICRNEPKADENALNG